MADAASGAGDNDRPLRRLQTCHVDDLLFLVSKTKGASDLHLAAGLPPVVLVDGKLMQAPYELVSAEISKRLLYEVMTDDQIREFESREELDFKYSAHRIGDFHVRAFIGTRSSDSIASAFHAIKQA